MSPKTVHTYFLAAARKNAASESEKLERLLDKLNPVKDSEAANTWIFKSDLPIVTLHATIRADLHGSHYWIFLKKPENSEDRLVYKFKFPRVRHLIQRLSDKDGSSWKKVLGLVEDSLEKHEKQILRDQKKEKSSI